VPTRVNSPADNVLDTRDSAVVGQLTFSSALLNANFTAANSVLNGINPIPNQTTGGEGAVSGEEVQFTVTFTTPFNLATGHYFFAPQVSLANGNFLWLSAPGRSSRRERRSPPTCKPGSAIRTSLRTGCASAPTSWAAAFRPRST
jgi:hypothetical protein